MGFHFIRRRGLASVEADQKFIIFTADNKGRFRAASQRSDIWRKMAKDVVRLPRNGSIMSFSGNLSEFIRYVSKDAKTLPECAPSSVVSSKRFCEDRSSVATTMPEKIHDDASWPEDLDDGVEQMCIERTSCPIWRPRLLTKMAVTTRYSWCSSSVSVRSVVAMSWKRCYQLVLVMLLQWPPSPRIGQQKKDTSAAQEIIVSPVHRRRLREKMPSEVFEDVAEESGNTAGEDKNKKDARA